MKSAFTLFVGRIVLGHFGKLASQMKMKWDAMNSCCCQQTALRVDMLMCFMIRVTATSFSLIVKCYSVFSVWRPRGRTGRPLNLRWPLTRAVNPLISIPVTLWLHVCVSPLHVCVFVYTCGCIHVWAECICEHAKKTTAANHIIQQDGAVSEPSPTGTGWKTDLIISLIIPKMFTLMHRRKRHW